MKSRKQIEREIKEMWDAIQQIRFDDPGRDKAIDEANEIEGKMWQEYANEGPERDVLNNPRNQNPIQNLTPSGQFVSRAGVTVNLNKVQYMNRHGEVIVFLGEPVWAKHIDRDGEVTMKWEEDKIAIFIYDGKEKAIEAERKILAIIGSHEV